MCIHLYSEFEYVLALQVLLSKFGKRTISSKNNHTVSPSIIVKDSVLTMSQLILLMTKCRNVYLHMYNSSPDVPTHAIYMEK